MLLTRLNGAENLSNPWDLKLYIKCNVAHYLASNWSLLAFLCNVFDQLPDAFQRDYRPITHHLQMHCEGNAYDKMVPRYCVTDMAVCCVRRD